MYGEFSTKEAAENLLMNDSFFGNLRQFSYLKSLPTQGPVLIEVAAAVIGNQQFSSQRQIPICLSNEEVFHIHLHPLMSLLLLRTDT